MTIFFFLYLRLFDFRNVECSLMCCVIQLKRCITKKKQRAVLRYTTQKMKFSIKNFFSKCDQIRSLLRLWSHLLKKSLIENFSAVIRGYNGDLINELNLLISSFLVVNLPKQHNEPSYNELSTLRNIFFLS